VEKGIEEKQKNWSTLKEMLFTYLAISKIGYWINNIIQLAEIDFENVGQLVLSRFIMQDLPIIFAILMFHFVDRFKINEILKYAIMYVVLLVGLHILVWRISYEIGFSFDLAVNFTIIYVVTIIILNIKYYLKQKENS